MVGGSGRLKVFWVNGDAISAMLLSISTVFGSHSNFLPRLTLLSVRLRQRCKIGRRAFSLVDLILPLMIELNDVGNCALSSSDSMSSRSMHSSSIDSIESDDRLLNERKQLVDFGDVLFVVFGGDGLGAKPFG